MDRSEELALIYLQSLELGTIIYEPNGRVAPDFAVGDIGIEVRRLNQNYEADGVYEGLESGQASMLRYVEKLLPGYGAPLAGQGWWVFFYFWRPFDGQAIKRALPRVLSAFRAAPIAEGAELLLAENFELEIRPAGIPVAQFFMLGGYADRDQGGLSPVSSFAT